MKGCRFQGDYFIPDSLIQKFDGFIMTNDEEPAADGFFRVDPFSVFPKRYKDILQNVFRRLLLFDEFEDISKYSGMIFMIQGIESPEIVPGQCGSQFNIIIITWQ